ncbi:MAG: toll/interleukin-1 receptor domain-containing protein [Anaerolineaceae bacterium]|nr:toll/interleukin-1 receptor domain-containing protein [Anaerolineaceae bacterium]
MTDIFISYSRKDIAYARLLHNALVEHGFDTWIDWEDIPPSVDWLSEIHHAIENANVFLFILSQPSALSKVCKKEIEHARENNKRIIPIVIDNVKPSRVHPALAALNWIFSRTEDELQPAIESLVEAIQTDYEWVKVHTRLQVDAINWINHQKRPSYLYSGAKLRDAEKWLFANFTSGYNRPEKSLFQWKRVAQFKLDSQEKSPGLTAIQQEFIEASIVFELSLSPKWYRKETPTSHYAPDFDLTCIHCHSIYVFTPSERLPMPKHCPVCGFLGGNAFVE